MFAAGGAVVTGDVGGVETTGTIGAFSSGVPASCVVPALSVGVADVGAPDKAPVDILKRETTAKKRKAQARL